MVKKIPNPRTAETTNVLRQVDLHHAPHTLDARGGKPSRFGNEKNAAIRSTIMPTADCGVPSTPKGPDPQWQAGHRQGYAEGLKAGQEQAKQEFRDNQARQGFEQGFEAGLARAHQQVEGEIVAQRQKLQGAFDTALAESNQECAQTIRHFYELIRRLPEQLSARMADMEDDMVELSFAMVCRILGDQLVTPDGVRALVSQATKDWPADADLSIHLHPDDLQRLRTVVTDDFIASSHASMLDLLSAELERRVRPPLHWVADASLDFGGCVLRSSKGGLDARLMGQLKALQDALLGVYALRRDQRQPLQAIDQRILDSSEPVYGALATKTEGVQS